MAAGCCKDTIAMHSAARAQDRGDRYSKHGYSRRAARQPQDSTAASGLEYRYFAWGEAAVKRKLVTG